MPRKRKLSDSQFVEIVAIADKILKDVARQDAEFVDEVRKYLPWFDGSGPARVRLRGFLSNKLHAHPDYWLDSCNDWMLVEFLKSVCETRDDGLKPPDDQWSKPMKRAAIARKYGVIPLTILRWTKGCPECFQSAPGRLYRVRFGLLDQWIRSRKPKK